MKNISVFAYATFGSPNGFTQSCIYGNKNLEKILNKFDLKSDAIQLLSPKDRIYSIRKELIQDNLFISYSVYTYAKEKSSNRGGTFIGTSLVFNNEVPKENKTLTSLHALHEKLKNSNVNESILNVNHSKDFHIQNIFPKDFEKLQFEKNNLSFLDWESTDKSLVIFVEKLDSSTIQNLFKKSLAVLSSYYSLYFIESKEIADFILQKRLIRLITIGELEEEITKLEEKRKKKTLDKISEFDKEKTDLEDQRKKFYSESQIIIKQNEEKQSENRRKIEESKINLNSQNIIYNNFLQKFDELITSLKTNKNLFEVNKSYREYKNNFDQQLRKIENTNSIQSFSNPRPTTNSPKHKWNDSVYLHNERSDNGTSDDENKSNKVYVFLIVSVLLNILLIILALFYYAFYYEKKQEYTFENGTQEEYKNDQIKTSDSIKLNPFPNDSINTDNKKKVVDLLKNNITIKEAVEVIFDKNPKSVGNIYKYQETDYSKLLFKKNPEAFSVGNNDTILFRKDSLKVIPSLKLKK